MKLLLIEDSRRLREMLTTGLRKMGYAIDSAADGHEGLRLARSRPYDVLILDLMLPGIDGLSLLRRLRDEGNPVHVLILTAKDAVPDRVAGLRAGADDYLPKPFAFDELVARIQALTRRSHGTKSRTVHIGDLAIDLVAHRAFRGGEEIVLTGREFALLEFLALHKGHVVTRQEIEEAIYDGRVEPASNAVDSAICVLRRKMDVAGLASLIQTRRGLGYVLSAQPSTSECER
jgi:DNA-binding response OmpR family regulator